MAVLVIAEHDGKQLKPGVTNTITGAAKLGDVTVLVVGQGMRRTPPQAAAKVAGVKKVLLCDAPHYAGSAAENIAALVRAHRARSTRTSSRRHPPPARTSCRASRRCSTCSRSRISAAVQSADTFVRPTYAGNVMATVQSSDPHQGHHRARDRVRSGGRRTRRGADREPRARA